MPGRIATCRSASLAVRVRRGSMTVSVPPRALQRLELAGEVGGGAQTAVGLEGVGADAAADGRCGPGRVRGSRWRRRRAARWRRAWASGRAWWRVKTLRVRSAASRTRRVERAGHGVHVGVAEDDADGVRAVPLDARRRSPAATASKASSQVASRSSPSSRTSGVRSRSGSRVEGAEGGALGADEALAEDVLAVAPGAGDPAALDGEGQPAGGLAQGADAQGGAGARAWASAGSRRRWARASGGWRHGTRGRGRAYRPVGVRGGVACGRLVQCPPDRLGEPRCREPRSGSVQHPRQIRPQQLPRLRR